MTGGKARFRRVPIPSASGELKSSSMRPFETYMPLHRSSVGVSQHGNDTTVEIVESGLVWEKPSH